MPVDTPAPVTEHLESTDLAVCPDAVREQLQRVLADPLFHASRRYSDMLTYVVDRTLARQCDSLKERIIGIEIFDRSPDYDTSIDSIVRVAAAEVRKRLSKYYLGTTHGQELRIELPIRSYVAEFRLPEEPIQQQSPPSVLPEARTYTDVKSLHARPDKTTGRLPFVLRKFFMWLTLAACISLCAVWSMEHLHASSRALDRFWAPMLDTTGKPMITIGSPVWLNTPRAVADATPLSANSGMTYSQLITHQENFPIADLSAASSMTSFLARQQKDSVIRLSDSATLSELHGNPLIVLGSFPNEWALRLGADLPFEFRREDDSQGIENVSGSGGGSWMINLRSPYEEVTSDYALITRATDKTTGQWWIGIGGVTVISTNAAEQIMIDPKEMSELAPGLPKDWERKNLQFVIEIKMVKGSPGASRIIAAKTW